ncbi:hypothetical protein KKI93_25020, partial [Xenorhabdus bovienii]|uniref:hypothetical protein n=1 Tax=Xenorhabdus bovienii TaxID=40576 RepID=UPI0023B2A0C3
MTHRQALDEMKEELLELALNKGYKISEIKLVLEELGISVNVKNINDVISENKKQKKSRKSNKKTTIPDEKINTQGSSEMIAPQNNPY